MADLYFQKKYSLKTYKPLRYDDIHFPKTSKFFVYELDGAYLFTFVDNENKNYLYIGVHESWLSTLWNEMSWSEKLYIRLKTKIRIRE